MNLIIRGLQSVYSLIMRGFGGGKTPTYSNSYIVCSSTDPDKVDYYVDGVKVRTMTSG